VADGGVLLRGGQEVGRLGVSEVLEPAADDPVRERVSGVDGEVGHRPGQPMDQAITGVPPRSAVQNQEEDPLWVGSSLDQAGEPLSKQGRLARPGGPGDQHPPSVEVQDDSLIGGGIEGEPRRHRSLC
jgi:hypothetical protein